MAGNFYAVLIGNREFPSEPGLPTLRCPLNDVKGMAELLRAEQHGPYDVSVLEDADHHVIHRAIYSALKKAGREDRVLIYYAGHGKLSEDDGSLYLASRNTLLDYLPATSVAAADVMKFMNSSTCKQLILILDCCYSGAVDKLLSGSVFRGEVADQIDGNLRGAAGSGSYILTASTSLQRAEEREGDENGLLTKHLIAGIRDGRADRDDDGLISMHELTLYVQDQVRAEGRQKPLAYTLREEDGGIIIAKTGKAARSRKLAELLDAIYAAAAARRASLRTVRSALTLLVAEPTASIEDKALCNEFVDRLHIAIRDSHQFIDVLEDAPAIVSRMTIAATRLQQAAAEQQRDEARKQLQAAIEQQERLRAEGTATSKLLAEADTNAAETAGLIANLQSEIEGLTKLQEKERTAYRSAEKQLQQRLADRQRRFSRLEAEVQAGSYSFDEKRSELETLLREQEYLRRAAEGKAQDLMRSVSEARGRIEELSAQVDSLDRELTAERERTKKGEGDGNTARNLLAKANADIQKLTQQLKEERSEKTALEEAAKAARIQAGIAQSAPEQQRQREAVTEKLRQPGGPFQPWKEPEKVLGVLRKFSRTFSFYIYPDIPGDKLAKATLKCVEFSPYVLALLDCTVFGSAKDCLLFGEDRMYWHNVTQSGMLRYAEIDPTSIRTDGASTLYVNGQLLHVSTGSRDTSTVVATLLKEIIALSR